MKNPWLMTLTILSMSSFIAISFADHFTLQYNETTGDNVDSCPNELVKLANNNMLAFSFYSKDYSSARLLGSPTPETSVAEKILLGNEGIKGEYAFMSVEGTDLQIGKNSYPLSQLWLMKDKIPPEKSWDSAFYVGQDKECLVATSPEAREKFLENEQIMQMKIGRP